MIEEWNEFLIWWFLQGEEIDMNMAEAAEIYFIQDIYMESV